MPSPVQTFDPKQNILSITHPEPIRLDEPPEIIRYFDEVVDFWRANCAGKKAWYLVCWDGYQVSARETETYARNVRRVVDECALAIVRYTSNPLQRTVGRLVGIKLHVNSHVYETREQALAVVDGLRAGTIRTAL